MEFEHPSQLNHTFLFAAIQISRGFTSPFIVGCQCIDLGCEANDFLKQKSQPVASQSSLPRQYGHHCPLEDILAKSPRKSCGHLSHLNQYFRVDEPLATSLGVIG